MRRVAGEPSLTGSKMRLMRLGEELSKEMGARQPFLACEGMDASPRSRPPRLLPRQMFLLPLRVRVREYHVFSEAPCDHIVCQADLDRDVPSTSRRKWGQQEEKGGKRGSKDV